MLEDLPELFLDLVCEHLSYEDVLALRSTCKGLKQFVDGKPFTKLNLFIRNYSYHHRLFYTDEWICYQHSLHSDDLTILNSNRFRERFRNVQQMIICRKFSFSNYKNPDTTEFDLYCLNGFKALRHLEITEMPGINGRLDLPELRIAAFEANPKEVIRYSWIELNCPRLRALKVSGCQPYLTYETDQLEYLQHEAAPNENRYLKSINPNLQKLSTICLRCRAISEFLPDLKTGAQILPSLIEIRMDNSFLAVLDELEISMQEFKNDPRTERIKFVLVGRLFNSPDELLRIAELIEDHIGNIDLIEHLIIFWIGGMIRDHEILFLNRTPELEFLLSGVRFANFIVETELTEQMIKKLKNVRSFEFLFCKPSISTFEFLAENCKLIDTLSLRQQTVTEGLLETLSRDLLNLTSLSFSHCEYETLKPLAKFQNLEEVHLDFTPPRDELTFIYENSRTLEVVNVSQTVTITVTFLRTTTRPRMCRIALYRFQEKNERYYFRTLHSMINYYYENRLFEERDSGGTSTRLINESSTSPELESND